MGTVKSGHYAWLAKYSRILGLNHYIKESFISTVSLDILTFVVCIVLNLLTLFSLILQDLLSCCDDAEGSLQVSILWIFRKIYGLKSVWLNHLWLYFVEKQESFAFLYSQSEPNNSLLSHFQFSQNRTDVFVTAQLDEEKKKWTQRTEKEDGSLQYFENKRKSTTLLWAYYARERYYVFAFKMITENFSQTEWNSIKSVDWKIDHRYRLLTARKQLEKRYKKRGDNIL